MSCDAGTNEVIKEAKYRLSNLHPVVQFLVLFLLVVELQHVKGAMFLLLAASLLLIAFLKFRMLLLQMLRRTRWLFLSMLVLYLLPDAFTMSDFGSHIEQLRESAILGGIQVLHLMAILASICLMTGGMSRNEQVEGLSKLMYPLALLGVEVKVLAVRVMLTMRYLEQHDLHSRMDKKQMLSALFEMPIFERESIQFSDASLKFSEKLLSVFIVLIILHIIAS